MKMTAQPASETVTYDAISPPDSDSVSFRAYLAIDL